MKKAKRYLKKSGVPDCDVLTSQVNQLIPLLTMEDREQLSYDLDISMSWISCVISSKEYRKKDYGADRCQAILEWIRREVK